MRFLPPLCVFCRHYNVGVAPGEPDCAAFAEIPDPIFRGDFDHRQPFPGDKGIRFELEPAFEADFAELETVRRELLQQGSPRHEPLSH
jgi:hypothetical protein